MQRNECRTAKCQPPPPPLLSPVTCRRLHPRPCSRRGAAAYRSSPASTRPCSRTLPLRSRPQRCRHRRCVGPSALRPVRTLCTHAPHHQAPIHHTSQENRANRDPCALTSDDLACLASTAAPSEASVSEAPAAAAAAIAGERCTLGPLTACISSNAIQIPRADTVAASASAQSCLALPTLLLQSAPPHWLRRPWPPKRTAPPAWPWPTWAPPSRLWCRVRRERVMEAAAGRAGLQPPPNRHPHKPSVPSSSPTTCRSGRRLLRLPHRPRARGRPAGRWHRAGHRLCCARLAACRGRDRGRCLRGHGGAACRRAGLPQGGRIQVGRS